MYRLICLFFCSFALFSCGQSPSQNSLPSQHFDRIQFIGRFHFQNNQSAIFNFSGAQIIANFKGSKISMKMRSETAKSGQNENYFNVYINEKLHKIIQILPNQTEYLLAENLTDTIHKITLFKRTEPLCGTTIFEGFILNQNDSLLPIQKEHQPIIEFIGNSLTCGYGNEVSIAPPPLGNPSTGFHPMNENNANAYGFLTAQKLQAQYLCVAYSGKGIFRNYDKTNIETIPQIYKNTLANVPENYPFQYTNHPDVIVINAGANDFISENNPPKDQLDSSCFVNNYSEFLKYLISTHPNAKIILTTGGFLTDAFPRNQQQLTRSKNYIKAVHQILNNQNILLFEFSPLIPPYGENWHPALHTHQKMAEELSLFIQENILKN